MVKWSRGWRWNHGGGACDGWLCGLLWFVSVRAGSICATVPPFMSLNWASGLWWAEFLDRLWCLLWWFVSWGVPFWFMSGVWWADHYDSRSRTSFLTQVLLGFVGGSSVLPKLSGGRVWSFEATYHCRLLFWSLLVVLYFVVFVDFLLGVGGFYFLLV